MKIKVEAATDEKLEELRVADWSHWECEPTEFNWHYEEEEVAYIKEGRVIVRTEDGSVEITPGNIVTFPAGLKCKWQVLETVRKVYTYRQ